MQLFVFDGALKVSGVCLIFIILFSFPDWIISIDLFLLWTFIPASQISC